MEVNKIYNEPNTVTMSRMPDGFIDNCITSPPYFGLRDYGTGAWEGGDIDCKHTFTVKSPYNENFNERWGHASGLKKQESQRHEKLYTKGCQDCGAIRIDDQIGLEETPELYVAKLVEVFTEVKRVMKDDGTLWLNLGDSYAGSGRGPSNGISQPHHNISEVQKPFKSDNIKPKDLIGIPWTIAFALRASGWYLRQDIIWAKNNPMPESVTDRCTKSHEYIFLLSKSAKYYFDQEAIGQKILEETVERYKRGWNGDGERGFPNGPQNHIQNFMDPDNVKRDWANKKSVWTVNTKPYSEAHFAVFPEELIEPCVLTTKPDAIIYDPFGGSGTTGVVALRARRSFILSELSSAYCEIAEKRLHPYLAQTSLF